MTKIVTASAGLGPYWILQLYFCSVYDVGVSLYTLAQQRASWRCFLLVANVYMDSYPVGTCAHEGVNVSVCT